VQTSLLFLQLHPVTLPHQYRVRLRVAALLDHHHGFPIGAELDFFNRSLKPELVLAQFFKPRNNTSTGLDLNQLHLNTTDPPDLGELVLIQKVGGLVIKAPLADLQVLAAVFDEFDLVHEVVLLGLMQLPIFFRTADVEFVLGLGLRGLEGAGEDLDLLVLHFLGHLGVLEVLVDHNSLDQLGLLQLAADFLADQLCTCQNCEVH